MECGICHEDFSRGELAWSFGYYRCTRCEKKLEDSCLKNQNKVVANRLEAVDQAKLQRRQEVHQLDKQIWVLREEAKHLLFAMDVLVENLNRSNSIYIEVSRNVLKAERSKRIAEIKRLQEQKKELKEARE